MKIKPLYHSRVSNKIVLERAGNLSTATEILEHQQLGMSGKVLGAPQDSPMHQAIVVPGTDRTQYIALRAEAG